ncbi:hypothetical protein NK212_15390 [Elizabethkingia sp. S0634]|uniref:hypothetical protein n=1 Tax=Elizabethkingia sp. S0634 TaxID=2957806 RepID=UPI0020A1AAE8|nr:hypothetical protein [Elizabethkingia sp. S0634]MCP1253241.1 hypothetical protein [Elizabethkingia sp. S0634]
MTPKQRSFAIYSVATLLLIIPLIGMLLSKEIKWSLPDFIIAGFLLFTTAFSIDLNYAQIANESLSVCLYCISVNCFISDLGGIGCRNIRNSISRKLTL